MNALKHLRKQAKALWKLEEAMPPKDREKHTWQLTANQGGVMYLFGKGGANTFFWRVGEKAKPEYAMPDEAFAVLDKWASDKFAVYAITKSPKLQKAKRQSKSVEDLKSRTHSKYSGHYIVGFNADGTCVRLFTFRTGLTGNEWVPVK